MKELTVRSIDVPHEFSSGCWGGLSRIDQNVFFGLCQHKIDENVRLCIYNDISQQVTEISQLQEILKKDDGAVAHGKIHTPFIKVDNFVYFGTHLGYYKSDIGDYLPYPGGRLICINLENMQLEDLGIMFPGEGIISLEVDRKRGHLYGFTWPNAHLIKYDINSNQISELGSFRRGDSGDTVCRSPVIVDDYLVFCTGDGVINLYNLETESFDHIDVEIPKVVLNEAIKSNWLLPEGVSSCLDIEEYVEDCKSAPGWGNLWHPAIKDPDNPALLVVTNTSSCLLRVFPREKKVEYIDQFCIYDNKTKYDIGTSTSLTLSYYDKSLYHIGTNLYGDLKDPKIKKSLLKYDIENKIQHDLGELKTADGMNVLYLQTLDCFSDGRLVGVGHVRIQEHEREKFIANNPAKVDLGIRAETNPYKMKLFIIDDHAELS